MGIFFFKQKTAYEIYQCDWSSDVCSSDLFSWIFFGFTAMCAFKFFRTVLNIEPYNKWFTFAKMKYLTNLYFVRGGLKGFWKYKTFCIEPSF